MARNLLLLSRHEFYILGLENISSDNEPIRARVVRINSDGIDQSYNGFGLVLGFDRTGDGLFAWNPFTSRRHNLHANHLTPEKPYTPKGPLRYGIGFDEFSRDCKVVLIRHYYKDFHTFEMRTDVHVCKLSNPSCWKLMDPFPLPDLHYISMSPCDGVFVSGALHWLVSIGDPRRPSISVLAIDLGTEKYRLMPLPPDQFPNFIFPILELGVLGGCLCVSFVNIRKDCRLEAWVMKEYLLVNSWDMLYAVKLEELGNRLAEYLPSRPVAYSDCRSQVLISLNGDLIWYHLQNKTIKRIELEGCQDPESWKESWKKEDIWYWRQRTRFTAIEYVGTNLPMGCDTTQLEIPATMQRERKST